jgi:hypothetical protein
MNGTMSILTTPYLRTQAFDLATHDRSTHPTSKVVDEYHVTQAQSTSPGKNTTVPGRWLRLQ